MKTSTNKLTYGLSIAALALVLSIGVSYVLAATYSEPPTVNSGGTPCTPTTSGCNIDAPVNVGASTQEKLGSLAINTQIPSLQTGLSVWGISNFFGSIKIADGTQGAGKILTSDANGLASWAPAGGSSGSADSYCVFKDTGAQTSVGYFNVPLTINGRNICTDNNGCSYRIWSYYDAYPNGYDFYGSSAITFRQNSDGVWLDSAGNQIGDNGDGVSKILFGDWHDSDLYDDWPTDDTSGTPYSVGVYTENSPDLLTFRDRSTTRGMKVSVCDF